MEASTIIISRRGRAPLLLLCICCCCFFLSSVHVRRASSLSFHLNFTDPGPGRPSCDDVQINCNGDASMNENTLVLDLTRNLAIGSDDSIGRATYAQPVPLWEAPAGGGGAMLLASFTTSFTFRITPFPGKNIGDGMAFFLAPFASATEIPPESGGGGFGLLAVGNLAHDSRFRFVAVEFDTWYNRGVDFSGNHMGIDNTSIVSMAYTNTSSPTGNLTSNLDMNATIRYHNDSKLLTADLQINGTSYHVNATIDLSSVLPEEVAVGFSAATGLSIELNQLLTWSFSSTLASKTPPPVTTMPTPPPETSSKPKSKLQEKILMRLLPSVLVPLLFLSSLCAAGGGYLILHRRRRSAPHEAGDDSSEENEELDRAELERGVAAGGPNP